MATTEHAEPGPTQAEESGGEDDPHVVTEARPATSTSDTAGVSTTYPNGMSGVSNTSTRAADLTAMKSSKNMAGRFKFATAMSGIYNKSTGTAANEEQDWNHLAPFMRHMKKCAKIRQERDAEERAELVKQMKQQLADEAKAAEGGATQGAGGTSDVSDGTSSVSITGPTGMRMVSSTSIVGAENGTEDWNHLTPEARMYKKLAKAQKERDEEEHVARAAKSAAERADVLKELKQQMTDEAKAAEEAAAQQGPGSCDACHGGPIPHVCS